MEDIKSKVEKLKQEAIDNPLKKKRGCKDCKKKADKPVESLPVIDESFEVEIVPQIEDMKLALDLMNGRPNEKDMLFIQWVYRSIFNEIVPTGCGACGTTAFRKLQAKYNQLKGIKG
jgi:hypothetical protein